MQSSGRSSGLTRPWQWPRWWLPLTVGLAVGAVFFAAAGASAQGLSRTVNEGLAYGTIVGWSTQDLRVTIMRVIQILFGFLGVVAILIILYAGWRWMTSGGDPQKVDEAKRTLVNAVLGLAIILMAFSIVSFILRSLSEAVGPQPGARRPPPLLACTNCDALGAGIIENVYPEPGARDVPRNTDIFVTFKLLMDPSSIIAGGNITNQILIEAFDPSSGTFLTPLPPAAVRAVSGNQLTFEFDPVDYLGDGIRDVTYRVTLGCGIKRDDGRPAFPSCGPEGGFAWQFTVGIRIDLTPPQITAYFPPWDDDRDVYGTVAAQQAQAQIRVAAAPQTAQVSRVEGLGKNPPAAAAASFTASAYSCAQDYFVCVQFTPAARFEVHPKDISAGANPLTGCTASDVAPGAWLPVAVEQGNSLVLGCGLSLGFTDLAAAKVIGHQWHFRAIAARTADTFRIGSGPTYTFVDGAPGSNQIEVGPPENRASVATIASRIATALDAPPQSPDVTASAAGATVTLRAVVAGSAGNRIQINATGAWLQLVSGFAGGVDEGFQQTPQGRRDVARNGVPRIDFSEAMRPLPISGPAAVDETAGAPGDKIGTINPANPPFVSLQVDINADGSFGADEYVDGTYLVSNRYQTVEFQAATLCGVCSDSGVSCTTAGDCPRVAESCTPIRNSCGDQIFCLPTIPRGLCPDGVTRCSRDAQCPGGGAGDCDLEANPGGVTHYRLTVHAATLFACTGPNDCNEEAFPDCVVGPPPVCQDAGHVRNYPLAGVTDGAMDAAKNSLDGNDDGNAQGKTTTGPGTEYSRNTRAGAPDSTHWTFWVNNRLELEPPSIVFDVNPDVDGTFPNRDTTGMPVTTVPTAQFNEVLLSSSLKPDNRYRDGRCGCRVGVTSDCRPDEECDADSETCRSKAGRDNFCSESTECPNPTLGCQNQQHATLVDYACLGRRPTDPRGRCVAWWIGNVGTDTDTPPDGFPDYTTAGIEHTPLVEFSRYGVEMGSGIKDLYQNCYLPSEGPGNVAGTGACGVSRALPYCCDGNPSATPCP